jgi:hypothetical protein
VTCFESLLDAFETTVAELSRSTDELTVTGAEPSRLPVEEACPASAAASANMQTAFEITSNVTKAVDLTVARPARMFVYFAIILIKSANVQRADRVPLITGQYPTS